MLLKRNILLFIHLRAEAEAWSANEDVGMRKGDWRTNKGPT